MDASIANSECYFTMDTIKMFEEFLEFFFSICPHDESVANVTQP